MVFVNCGYNQIIIMNYVVVGEDFWVRCLESKFIVGRCVNMVFFIKDDIEIVKLRCWVRLEIKCNNYSVGFQYKF